MNIIGNDFNIKLDSGTYILYIKSKTGKAKLGGYFTNLHSALHNIYVWRKGKKYPHKESPKEMLLYIKELEEINGALDSLSMSDEAPYTELDKQINGIRGIYDKSRPKYRSNDSRTP